MRLFSRVLAGRGESDFVTLEPSKGERYTAPTRGGMTEAKGHCRGLRLECAPHPYVFRKGTVQLNQVKAIVTGGASGLGYGVAKHLAEQGAKVALFDISAEKGAQAVAALGANARYFGTDVSSEEQVIANTQAAQAWLGGLNAAINCAGILGAGRVLGKEGPMPLKTFETTVRVNLIGSFNVAKAAADLMQHNAPGEDGERGVIVNTASIAAFEGQIGQAAYSASKGGVVGM